MKKITLLLLFVATTLYSQSTFSVKGGLSIVNNVMGSSQAYEPSGRISYFAGAAYEYKPNEFSFEAELQYTNSGSKGSASGSDVQLNLSTINLLGVVKYYFNEHAAIKLGGYAGYIADANLEYGSEEYNYKDVVKPIDAGLVFGADFNLYKGLFVDAKLLLGLTDLNDTDADGFQMKIKNRAYQLGIGYKF